MVERHLRRAPLPRVHVGSVAARALRCGRRSGHDLLACSGSGGGTEPDVGAAAERELERIDALLSNYRSDSTLEQFNATRSVEPLELPSELVALLGLAKRVHAASDGCFDPTVRPLVRAWGFDGDAPAVPSAASSTRRAQSSASTSSSCSTPRTCARRFPSSRSTWRASARATRLDGSRAARTTRQHGVSRRDRRRDRRAWSEARRRAVAHRPREPRRRGARRARAANSADARTAVVTSGSYRHYSRRRRPPFRPHHRSTQRLARRACVVVRHRRRPRRGDGGSLGHGTACAWARTRARRPPSARESSPLFWIARDGEAATSAGQPGVCGRVAGAARRAAGSLEPPAPLEVPKRQQRRRQHQHAGQRVAVSPLELGHERRNSCRRSTRSASAAGTRPLRSRRS